MKPHMATQAHHRFVYECSTPSVFSIRNSAFAFPASLFIFLTGLVSLIMPFYNTILRVAGHTWQAWSYIRTSPILSSHHQIDIAATYRRKRPPSNVSRSKRHLLLAAFGLLTNTAISGHNVSLSSELQER